MNLVYTLPLRVLYFISTCITPLFISPLFNRQVIHITPWDLVGSGFRIGTGWGCPLHSLKQ